MPFHPIAGETRVVDQPNVNETTQCRLRYLVRDPLPLKDRRQLPAGVGTAMQLTQTDFPSLINVGVRNGVGLELGVSDDRQRRMT